MHRLAWLGALLLLASSACTLHYSKQALHEAVEPSTNATFITEEDSGLQLLSLFQLSEPDHFAVLIARAKRRYSCAQLHSIQLDFYSEVWVLVSFPIARITAVCEPLPLDPPPVESAATSSSARIQSAHSGVRRS